MKDWLYYFGGLADKIEGRVIPLERAERPQLHAARAARRDRRDRAVELADLPHDHERGAGAGRRQHDRDQAVGDHVGLGLRARAPRRGSRHFRPGVDQRRHRRARGGRGAGRPRARREDLVHRERGAAARRSPRAPARASPACTLELGGKSPNIVFDDANLDQAEAGVLAGIFAAAGQTCVAGSRAFVHERIYDEFVERLVSAREGRSASAIRCSPTTQMGPVATKMQLEKDEQMVERAVARGRAGAARRAQRASVAGFDDGLFFEPTILHRRGPQNHIMNEEVFGPVLAVTPFRDDDEVVRLANATRFGLAAGVWTRDLAPRPHDGASGSQAGTVWINIYRALDVQLALRRLQVERPRARRTASRRWTSTCRPRACGASLATRCRIRLIMKVLKKE